MIEPADIGRLGEEAATEYLRREGFEILALNWRDGRFELDIVAQWMDEIHFIEVKTRSTAGWTDPEEALDRRKRRALSRAVERYLALNPTRLDPRIGLIAVDLTPEGVFEVRFYPDAVEQHW